MPEKTGIVTMMKQPVTLVGRELKVGDKAPDFSAVNNDLSEFRLSSLAGKVVILSAVPSLDTRVCEKETKRWSAEAEKLGSDVVIVTVSMDLPFAQKRWMENFGITRIKTVSDHRDAEFGKKYGVLMKEVRLLARAVFVVDKKGRISYIQIVPEIGREPDYKPVLDAARRSGALAAVS